MNFIAVPDHDSERPIKGKTLSFDADWINPPVNDIEVLLLRNAAFPEVLSNGGLAHEFVLLDPSTAEPYPRHQDTLERLVSSAERMGLPHAVIAHQSNDRFGGGGFAHTIYELADMGENAFGVAFASLRERVGWVLRGSRFNQRRHLFVPHCDGAMLAAIVELLATIPNPARPFVHLATHWTEATMPNASRFAPLQRYGQAIQELNSERPTLFLYAWSKSLAKQLSQEIAAPVTALDHVPELSLRSEGERQPDRFTVGYFGGTGRGSGFDRLAGIIRGTNQAAISPRKIRFVVQTKPATALGGQAASAKAAAVELAAIPERNVTVIEEFLPRHLYFQALKQVDALLLPYTADPGAKEVQSSSALHAMAAGKLIFTFDNVRLAHANPARVMSARDEQNLGELIADVSHDLTAVRTSAKLAKNSFWSGQKPARLFAQLLYGPLILANADGHELI